MATVRRVRRIIRKIDPWTALKVSTLIWAVMALAIVLGVIIFWSILERAGLPQRITEFLVEITLIGEGSQPFANTEQFLRFVVFSSVVWWIAMTGLTVGGAVVYNLVSDVVGGLEVVVLEETLNPIVTATPPALHPPADYRTGNGGVTTPDGHADLPTEETEPVPARLLPEWDCKPQVIRPVSGPNYLEKRAIREKARLNPPRPSPDPSR